MKLVSIHGDVYKMSDSKYKQLLQLHAREDLLDNVLDKSTHVGTLESFHIEMTPAQASAALVNIKKGGKK